MEFFAPDNRRRLVLKSGKERVVANRHPWIFAGAIAKESGPADAAIADLVDGGGRRIACGLYSASSQIRLRALVFGDDDISAAMLEARIASAVSRRTSILTGDTNAVRLINSEGDGLSGLVVDRYDDILVVEIANSGLEKLRDLVVDTLRREVRPRGIWFQNDLPARKLEHIPTEPSFSGDGEPAATIRENGLQFIVDPRAGQKTGFFIDQRENRQLARQLSAGARVLNLFSYTGAFGVYAATGGAAEVENVDVSAAAIDFARRNHDLNGSADRAQFTVADCFQFVRQRASAAYRTDLVICDPPAFAKSRGDIDRAARGYKDINLFSLKLVAPGGRMMTFSCSGHMPLDLFQKVIFAAALDAGRRVSFIRRLTAGPDHPVSLHAPEGEYLKGFLLEVLD